MLLGPGNLPPPIIIRLASEAVRPAILKNKKSSTPPPEEGAKKLILVEDLTPPTHRKMKELLEDDRVSRVWSRNGTLFVVPCGENARLKIVKSVFDSNDKILG